MLKGEISISLRLTLWFGGIFLAGWVLFGMSMWLNLRSTLKNERRQTLSRRLDRLQELLVKDQISAPHDRFQDFTDFAHATGNGLAEVLYPDGTHAYPSPSVAAAAFPWPTLRLKGVDLFETVQNAGQSYWVMSRQVDLLGQTVVLLAAAPEAGNLLVLQAFVAGLLASAPILLLVSSAGGYWVSRRALMPVDRITATARSISIGNISERIPVTQTGDELQRLTETCNSMLDRLESSVTQIKRFTADASHELRGPLSFTRTVAEIALRNPHADTESRRALQDIVDEAAKAAVLLEDMLTLARADAAPIGICHSQVDLATVLEEVCEIAQPIAKQQNLTLSKSFDHGAVLVLGDPAALKRLLWILLDNALKYSNPQGAVGVSLSRVSGQGRVVVRDNGIGISATDLPFVFDRFYRADPSRSMVEGNGLGLAIAKWIAETHRAELSVESEEGVGTSFTILFPGPRMSPPAEIVRGAAPELKQLAT
jgi:heavy metal sensor kinase